MSSSVTVKEVAELAQVSVGTVSRVFNNHHNVNEETRQKVPKVAAELGYLKSGKQSASHQPNSRLLKQIGFLLYSPGLETTKINVLGDPFWSVILHGVESEADKFNIGVTYKQISRINATPQLLLNTIYDMRLGGILLVGPVEAELVNLLQTVRLPLVMVDNYLPNIDVDAVLSDNYQGAKQAVEHLLEQGHRKIAFIGGPIFENRSRPVNKIYTFEQRAEGYRRALFDANIEIDYNLWEHSDNSPEGGYEACKRLLARKADFTALFCVNDPGAIWAMKALRDAGLRVPEDVSVVGFDDIETAQHLTPALTTIRVPKEEMGARAVRELMTRFVEPERTNTTSTLRVQLIKRESVRPYTQ